MAGFKMFRWKDLISRHRKPQFPSLQQAAPESAQESSPLTASPTPIPPGSIACPRQSKSSINANFSADTHIGFNRASAAESDNEPGTVSGDAVSPSSSPPDGHVVIPHFPPISEVWDEAYDELANDGDTKELTAKYEAVIRKDSHIGDVAKDRNDRRDQMREIAKQKTEWVEAEKWKVKFKGHDLAVRDLVVPIASIVQWSKDYVGSALEASPPASMAWAGVFLLLQPLLLNPSKQDAARIKGLDQIARIIRECSVREAIYKARYESTSDIRPHTNSVAIHAEYRNVIRNLYSKIIAFQITYICYLDNNTVKRWAQDTIDWQGWDSSVQEISDQNSGIKSMDEHWRDLFEEEESRLRDRRHEEHLERLDALQRELERFRALVEDAQKVDHCSWLRVKDVKPSKYFNTNIERRVQQDTGKWLLQSDDLQNWMETPNSFIWLRGKAGAGKSVLSSTVIQHIEDTRKKDPYTSLAYFFVNFQVSLTHSKRTILSSLITQLVGRRPDVPEEVLALKTYRDRTHDPPLRALEDALRSVVEDFKATYLIIDGLDEFPLDNSTARSEDSNYRSEDSNYRSEDSNNRSEDSRRDILDLLEAMQNWKLESLHLFVTSRPDYDIETSLKDVLAQSQASVLDLATHKSSQEVTNDIGRHIDKELERDEFKYLGRDLKLEIRDALVKKADGVFLYASLQLSAFRPPMSKKKVHEVLSGLPDDLYKRYDESLEPLSRRHPEKTQRLLIWIAFPQVPLTLQELSMAVLLNNPENAFLPATSGRPNNANLLVPVFEEDDVFFDPLDVRHFLPGLHDIQPRREGQHKQSSAAEPQDIMLLSHSTLLEYLTSNDVEGRPASDFRLDKHKANLYMAQACLRYFIHFTQIQTQQDTNVLRQLRSLLHYAACHGLRHIGSIQHKMWPSSLQRLVKYILHDDIELYTMLKQIANYPARQINDKSLHYAFENQLHEIVSFLLDKKLAMVDSTDEEGQSVIFRASRNGDLGMLQLLFEYKPDVHLTTKNGTVALQAAIAQGHRDVAEFLRVHDADIHVVTKHDETILHLALGTENEEMVQWALKQDVDINAAAVTGETALHRAVKLGNSKILKLLLSAGAETNVVSREGETPLLYAAKNLRSNPSGSVCQMMLEHGAEINVVSKEGETPLLYAAKNLRSDPSGSVCHMMLEHGAEINVVSREGDTPLLYAARYIQSDSGPEACQMMLDYGADATFANHTGETALYLIARNMR